MEFKASGYGLLLHLKFYHFTGGYYLYMEATGRSFNSKSRLVSKLFPATPGRKMKFFYYMYGKSVNYLRILMNDTIREREIWRKIGNQGQRWIYGEVILVAARPYKVNH